MTDFFGSRKNFEIMDDLMANISYKMPDFTNRPVYSVNEQKGKESKIVQGRHLSLEDYMVK